MTTYTPAERRLIIALHKGDISQGPDGLWRSKKDAWRNPTAKNLVAKNRIEILEAGGKRYLKLK